jgi:hypothetical protein
MVLYWVMALNLRYIRRLVCTLQHLVS